MKRFLYMLVLTVALCLPLCGTCALAGDTGEISSDLAIDGVQIRVTGEQGLRFIATLQGQKQDYEEVGILVIPTSRITGGELLVDTPDVGTVSSKNAGFRYWKTNPDSFSYTVCLIGIKIEDYERDYTVRAFARKNGQLYYSAVNTAYDLSVLDVAKGLMVQEADSYTSEKKDDIDALEAIIDSYNAYLRDNETADPEEPEGEEPAEEEIEVTTVNSYYWTHGTISGTNGAVNTANTTRIYTPAYFPVENLSISYDGTGVNYAVLVYDENYNYIGHNNVDPGSTNSWISSNTFTVDDAAYTNGTPAYVRFVLKKTNDADISQAEIPSLSTNLTIKTPLANTFRIVEESEWTIGKTISSSDGKSINANAARAYTDAYYPAEGLEISYDGSTFGGDKLEYLIMEYDANKVWNSTSSYRNFGTYGTVTLGSNTAYVRFAIRTKNLATINASNLSTLVSHLTIKARTGAAVKSFFEIGDIDSAGNPVASTVSARTPSYIPANVVFDFDSSLGGSYTKIFYNSAYARTADESQASYYKLVLHPGCTVTLDNIDNLTGAFSSFRLNQTLTADDWAFGTIAGLTGAANTANTTRIHTPAYIPVENLSISYSGTGSDYAVLAYDKDLTYVGHNNVNPGNTNSWISTPSFTIDNSGYTGTPAYVRFVLKKSNGADIAQSDIASLSALLTVSYSEPIFARERITVGAAPGGGADTREYMDESKLLFRFSYSGINAGNYLSDFCFVEDELWLFSTSDKASDGSGIGTVLRYSIDFDTGTAVKVGTLTHNFGHTNSINYNSENHSLTFGNGSGSFSNTENYFYVYENPYEKVQSGATFLDVADAVTYDWSSSGITYMSKLNAAWYGRNSLLVNANNNGYVYKIALGTGDRILSLGTRLAVNSENGYNGTWEIIKSYEMPDNRPNAQAAGYTGQGYDQCNQGSFYADGTLYLTCGHDGVYFWECTLNGDGTISRKETHKYVKIGGSPILSAISGILVYDNYLYFGNGGYIHIYSR